MGRQRGLFGSVIYAVLMLVGWLVVILFNQAGWMGILLGAIMAFFYNWVVARDNGLQDLVWDVIFYGILGVGGPLVMEIIRGPLLISALGPILALFFDWALSTRNDSPAIEPD